MFDFLFLILYIMFFFNFVKRLNEITEALKFEEEKIVRFLFKMLEIHTENLRKIARNETTFKEVYSEKAILCFDEHEASNKKFCMENYELLLQLLILDFLEYEGNYKTAVTRSSYKCIHNVLNIPDKTLSIGIHFIKLIFNPFIKKSRDFYKNKKYIDNINNFLTEHS